MKEIIIYTLLLFLIACQSNKEKFERKITNGEVKYWDYIVYDNLNYKNEQFPHRGVYFNNKGVCIEYYYEGPNKKRVDIDYKAGGDLIISSTWNYINDTLIKLRDYKYSVRKLTTDTLVLFDIYDNYLSVLVKSEFQSSRFDSVINPNKKI